MSGPLEALRREVRRVDREIVAMVAERVRLAREIGATKQAAARATLDPAREAAVIREATALGRDAGLDPEDARNLFWMLIDICRRAQLGEGAKDGKDGEGAKGVVGGPVGVVGLGLIGGSIARDLMTAGAEVIGIDEDAGARAGSVAEGVVAHAVAPGDDLPAEASAGLGPAGLDLIVVATPVSAVPGVLRWLAGRPWAQGSVITDACSTKRSVLRAADAAGLGARFVGGHPMAGDTRRGWAASRAGLFRDARVWLCRGAADDAAVDRVGGFWRGLGARPESIDAATHDRLLAGASHLPQAAASALAAVLSEAGIPRDALGPGGRDATRLAASDPDLWTGILLDNHDEVRPALDALARGLDTLAAALERADPGAVRAWLEAGARWG